MRAEQLTFTRGPFFRLLRSWMVRAASSLPVPVSPVMSTVALDAAASSMSSNTSCMGLLFPTSRWNFPPSRSTSSSSAALLRSACLSAEMSVSVSTAPMIAPSADFMGLPFLSTGSRVPSARFN